MRCAQRRRKERNKKPVESWNRARPAENYEWGFQDFSFLVSVSCQFLFLLQKFITINQFFPILFWPYAILMWRATGALTAHTATSAVYCLADPQARLICISDLRPTSPARTTQFIVYHCLRPSFQHRPASSVPALSTSKVVWGRCSTTPNGWTFPNLSAPWKPIILFISSSARRPSSSATAAKPFTREWLAFAKTIWAAANWCSKTHGRLFWKPGSIAHCRPSIRSITITFKASPTWKRSGSFTPHSQQQSTLALVFFMSWNVFLISNFPRFDIRNSIAGSAVCSFTLDSMQESFAGPFRSQSNPTSTWESVHSSHTHSHCNSHHSTQHSTSSSSLLEAEKYQLMDRAVQPITRQGKTGNGPLIRLDLERVSHIAVDVVATKIHSSVHVLYVASRDGLVRKYSILPRTQEACLVEIINPLALSSQLADRQIKTMQFLKQQVCHHAIEKNLNFDSFPIWKSDMGIHSKLSSSSFVSFDFFSVFENGIPCLYDDAERSLHRNGKWGDPTGSQPTM